MSDLRTLDAGFTIDSWDEVPYDEPADGPKLVRATLRKTYSGALEGTGAAEVLIAGSGGYVASERVVGSLEGRQGSFVVQHSGVAHEDGSLSTSGVIIASSGTGELASLSGEAVEAQQGVLTLRYAL